MEASIHANKNNTLRPSRDLIVIIIAACTYFTALGCFYLYSQPEIVSRTVRLPDGNTQGAGLPLILENQKAGSYKVRFDLTLSRVHHNKFQFYSSSCLEKIIVNRKTISLTKGSKCYHSNDLPLDLSEYLRPGTNRVKAIVKNFGGRLGFDIRVAPTDPLKLAVSAAFYVGLVLFLGLLFWRVPKSRKQWGVILPIFIGTILRIAYCEATDPRIRSHDIDAHVAYIHYLSEFGSIPHFADGFEYHQAPLYYSILSLIHHSAMSTGLRYDTFTVIAQYFSTLCAIGMLLVGVWIATMAFSGSFRQTKIFILGFFIATIPAGVFMASRISNDPLVQLLCFTCIGLLIFWWKQESKWTWYFLSLTLSLALLTKTNAVLVVPSIGLALLFHSQISIKTKLHRASLMALILIAFTGWYVGLRYQQGQARVMGSIEAGFMDDKTLLKNELGLYLTFSPEKVLKIPFNQPFQDSSRRQYFLEYLFRSVFFGEYNFGWKYTLLAKSLLASGMLWLGFALLGVFRGSENSSAQHLSLVLVTGSTLLTFALFRFVEPFAPHQDFRFIVFLLPSFGYLAVNGANSLRMRRINISILSILPTLSLVFYLLIYFDFRPGRF